MCNTAVCPQETASQSILCRQTMRASWTWAHPHSDPIQLQHKERLDSGIAGQAQQMSLANLLLVPLKILENAGPIIMMVHVHRNT